MFTKSFFLSTSLLLTCNSFAGEYHLDAVAVEGKKEGAIVEEKITKKSSVLAKEARGETLGDYLENETFIDSASYGPAVGRPVVKGMDGYRVGVTNGNIALNDLSAMSQDHAVGIMPRATQKIEFIKGPASLLYGSYSGGVIRALGEEHNREFAKEGLRGDATGSYGSNGAGKIGSVTAEAAEGDFSAFISSAYHEAEAFRDGNGNLINDSDTLSTQTHGVLGYRLSDENNFKLYFDTMDKEYGIPNATEERTSINMNQDRYGLVWHNKNLFDTFEYLQSEISYSDYLHDELEGGSADGLFGQKQLNLSTAFGLDFGDWHMDTTLEYQNGELKVCHEHGKCTTFRTARRSPFATDGSYMSATTSDSDNPDGLPFSHGHPMPNIDESLFKGGVALRNFYDDSNEITLSARTDVRQLTPDSSNIQQVWLMPTSIDPNYYDAINDAAFSGSIGWYSFLARNLTMQTSLSYIQRLPASTELFWNGFHHATNSYIMGDRYLKNEESVNFDLDVVYNLAAFTTQGSIFYYDFANYIYQTPLIGNGGVPINVNTISGVGHNALAWGMEGAGARVYGAALKESYAKKFGAHGFEASLAFEAIKGELKSGGYIPRMPPFSATTSLKHTYKALSSRVSYKQVDESRFEGAYETQTPSYGWLSAYIEYLYKNRYADATLFLKGENLTDAQAYNHLSFLKATAPYAGRQVSGGISLRF